MESVSFLSFEEPSNSPCECVNKYLFKRNCIQFIASVKELLQDCFEEIDKVARSDDFWSVHHVCLILEKVVEQIGIGHVLLHKFSDSVSIVSKYIISQSVYLRSMYRTEVPILSQYLRRRQFHICSLWRVRHY